MLNRSRAANHRSGVEPSPNPLDGFTGAVAIQTLLQNGPQMVIELRERQPKTARPKTVAIGKLQAFTWGYSALLQSEPIP